MEYLFSEEYGKTRFSIYALEVRLRCQNSLRWMVRFLGSCARAYTWTHNLHPPLIPQDDGWTFNISSIHTICMSLLCDLNSRLIVRHIAYKTLQFTVGSLLQDGRSDKSLAFPLLITREHMPLSLCSLLSFFNKLKCEHEITVLSVRECLRLCVPSAWF